MHESIQQLSEWHGSLLALEHLADLGFPSKHSCYSAPVVLEIIKYGHPVLREKGKRIDHVTPELRQLAADMVQTMYAADGVGLAAQQIGKAILLTVIDVTASEQPSGLLVNGQPQDLTQLMPLVLLNPVVSHPTGEQTGSEGCLSIPDVSAQIRRAAKVTVTAQNLDGQPVHFECTGLLARAVQHELDHLQGILFVDRMDAATKASFSGKLKKLHKETEATLVKPAKARRTLVKS
jgi:peptide deformylase